MNTSSIKVTVSELKPTILIVDSGIGGLSIYSELRKLLPNMRYLYTFDNIAFPYGEKDEIFIIERVTAITEAIARLYPLSMEVIACNTASSVSLSYLRTRFKFPIVGVIPAIKTATKITKNGIIGLLATQVTAYCSCTQNLIMKYASNHIIKIIGSNEMAKLAEMKLRGHLISLDSIRRILQSWLYMDKLPDTIVLGCTHFSLLTDELKLVLPNSTKFITSNKAIANYAAWLIKHKMPDTHSKNENLAFYTKKTLEAIQLIPILQNYGFKKLEKLDT